MFSLAYGFEYNRESPRVKNRLVYRNMMVIQLLGSDWLTVGWYNLHVMYFVSCWLPLIVYHVCCNLHVSLWILVTRCFWQKRLIQRKNLPVRLLPFLCRQIVVVIYGVCSQTINETCWMIFSFLYLFFWYGSRSFQKVLNLTYFQLLFQAM